MQEQLRHHFNRTIDLSTKEIQHIERHFKLLHLKRRHFFIQEGNMVHDVAFVLQGCLRSYSIDENGFEHILQFAPEGWWITDMNAFITQQAATIQVDALMDSTMYCISRESQLRLCEEIPLLEKHFRILTENALAKSQQRIIDYLSTRALDRWSKFCAIYPGLVHTLPQKHIASYIGVTPEFLSKMKKQYLAKEKK